MMAAGLSANMSTGQLPTGLPMGMVPQQSLTGLPHANQHLAGMHGAMVGAEGFPNGMHTLAQQAAGLQSHGVSGVMPPQQLPSAMDVSIHFICLCIFGFLVDLCFS